MATRAELAYALARLHARHGQRPADDVWQALSSSRTAAHGATLVRGGAMAAWIEGLDELGDAHRTERHLRWRWRRYVDEVAGWLPPRWRSSTEWFGALPELLLTEDAPPGDEAASDWLARWEQGLPRDAGPRAPLRRPAELLLPRLRGEHTGRSAAAPAVRASLQRLFRRPATPMQAVYAHLALVALDLERLRGELTVLALFEARPVPGNA